MRRQIVIAFVLIGLIGCAGPKQPRTDPTMPDPVIDTFYPSIPAISKGETGVLCYGVQGATSVRIEPPIEQLHPALTYCFEVKPVQTTTYTLIARSRGGKEVRRQSQLIVGGSRPKLHDMVVNATEVIPGGQILLCWKSSNATAVEAGPGKYQHGGRASDDCIEDHPRKTTSYTVTVSNAAGFEDTDSIEVKVKGSS